MQVYCPGDSGDRQGFGLAPFQPLVCWQRIVDSIDTATLALMSILSHLEKRAGVGSNTHWEDIGNGSLSIHIHCRQRKQGQGTTGNERQACHAPLLQPDGYSAAHG